MMKKIKPLENNPFIEILFCKMYTFRVCSVCIGSTNAIAGGP